MADMYTDLERTIFNCLNNGLIAAGFTGPTAIEVLNIQDDTTFPSQKAVIRFAKVYDLPNDDAPRGPGSEILTPVTNVSGQITSYSRQDWPEGYKINYKINCCAEDIATIRAMETALHRVFRPKHPVYLYNADTNLLTSSYCDISYRGFLNQDNLDLGFFSRATILQFEVYDYNSVVTSVPAMTGMEATIELGVTGTPTPGVDIVITP